MTDHETDLECDICGGPAIFDGGSVWQEDHTAPCLTCGHVGIVMFDDDGGDDYVHWEPLTICGPMCVPKEHHDGMTTIPAGEWRELVCDADHKHPLRAVTVASLQNWPVRP